MSSYRVAPIFLIRAAGVPFDHLDRLATTETAAAARRLLVRRREFQVSKGNVEELLRSGGHGLSNELFQAWRKAIRSGEMPPATDQTSSAFALCWECARQQAMVETELEQAFERELDHARRALIDSSREILPRYLVFGAGDFRDRLSDIATTGERNVLPPRNARARERERHLVLYLQRVCSKNDTFSQFGPSAWGRVTSETEGFDFQRDAEITMRQSFLERWVARVAVAAVNQDCEARAELAPRCDPHGRIEKEAFYFTEPNERILLDAETVALLRRCDGQTPAYALGVPLEKIEQLAHRRILRWELEVLALEPHAFAVLTDQIRSWRDGPARKRWLENLEPIGWLPKRFLETSDVSERMALMDEARQRLTNLGGEQKSLQRHLYAAANPIAEECFRDSAVRLNEALTDNFTREVEPWIDLWRDTYAFVASRVAAGLRRLFETTPKQDGAVPLPAFLRHCAINQMPMQGHGSVVLAHQAFQEVKAAFRKKIEDRADASELELTTDDCHVVRENFDYPKFDEYTYPSADLQISAASAESVAAGQFQWVVAELHPPPALLHHCFYWSCPDVGALSNALQSTTSGKPFFHFGFAAADFTAHTTLHIFDALPQLSYFIAPQCGQRSFNAILPSETEVYLDKGGDVCVRTRASKQHLGSFARAWLIPLGFHPFHFGRTPHMPRLRCGSVIVQRRSWTVGLGEFPSGNFTGVSRDLVLAIEQLRAEKDWPRHIYIRPTEQALRRSGAEGRDKDTKPVYIDLESYLSLEIFHRWLTKSGELEVTEMLPDPDHLCWQESDGRRTFELRTLIVPRA